MKPRYVVSSVTGHPIGNSGAPNSRPPHTIWSVLDSAYCYRPVSTFAKGNTGYLGGTTSYGWRGERDMRALAARLNALDLLGCPMSTRTLPRST